MKSHEVFLSLFLLCPCFATDVNIVGFLLLFLVLYDGENISKKNKIPSRKYSNQTTVTAPPSERYTNSALWYTQSKH